MLLSPGAFSGFSWPSLYSVAAVLPLASIQIMVVHSQEYLFPFFSIIWKKNAKQAFPFKELFFPTVLL